MVGGIIEGIQRAEEQAAALVESARAQARDILAQGERRTREGAEAILSGAHADAKALLTQAALEARERSGRRIDEGMGDIGQSADKARENIGAAVALIVERVGENGD